MSLPDPGLAGFAKTVVAITVSDRQRELLLRCVTLGMYSDRKLDERQLDRPKLLGRSVDPN
jgi:hypothetical protein